MKNSKCTKFLAFLLSIVMCLCTMSVIAFAVESNNSPYVYKYTNWYARSVHRYTESGSTSYYLPATYLLEANGKEYAAYCVDLSVSAVKSTMYKRLNLEDVTYFKDASTASKVRTIVNNGYWPDDSANTLAALRKATGISNLTAAEALSGTQLAIWNYGNSGNVTLTKFYGASKALTTASSRGTYQDVVGNTTNEHGDLKNDFSATTEKNIKAVRDYLLNLGNTQATEVSPEDIIINNAHFVKSYKVTSTDGSVVNGYEVTVKFNLVNTNPQGDLTLKAVQNGKTVYTSVLNKVPTDNGEYAVTFKTNDIKSNVTLSLSGTQEIAHGVYFYQAEQVSSSQSFVGKGSGSTHVDATASISLKNIEVADHNYDEGVVTKEPTCTEEGEKTYTCKNDPTHTYTEPVAPKDHEFDEGVVTKEPTCIEEGEKTYTCKNDTTHTYTEPIEPKGHTPVKDEPVDPTCTDKGLTEGSHCSECGEPLEPQEELKETGHDYDDGVVTKEPTCTEEGEKTYTCKNDPTHTYTEPVEPKGHTPVIDEAVEPTCNEKGKTEGSHCSECGEILVQQEEIKELGHDYDDGVVTKEPTCTEEGEKTYTCKNDSTHTYTEPVEPKGHTPVIDEAVEPTCTEKGKTEGSHCSECGEVLVPQEDVEEIGHNYEVVVTKEPTCTEEGEKTYTCKNDPTHTYTEVIEPNGHTPVVDEPLNPTCTETGLTEGSHCSVCDEVLVPQEVVEETGHDYDDGVVIKEPTCTEEGEIVYTCRNDAEHNYKEPIKLKEHKIVIDKAVKATDKKTGLTEGSHCSECGKVIVKQNVVAKLTVEIPNTDNEVVSLAIIALVALSSLSGAFVYLANAKKKKED